MIYFLLSAQILNLLFFSLQFAFCGCHKTGYVFVKDLCLLMESLVLCFQSLDCLEALIKTFLQISYLLVGLNYNIYIYHLFTICIFG